MAHGKSIKIYLPDGSPTGLRYAELANWTGQAVACPRSRFHELSDWEELKRPGVYFLLVGSDIGDRGRVYIGEAENVYKRLVEQVRSKDFWNEIVIFTSKDENLTKSHVKYLESRLIALSQEANRYDLDNTTIPQCPSLPRSDVDAMEEYYRQHQAASWHLSPSVFRIRRDIKVNPASRCPGR